MTIITDGRTKLYIKKLHNRQVLYYVTVKTDGRTKLFIKRLRENKLRHVLNYVITVITVII